MVQLHATSPEQRAQVSAWMLLHGGHYGWVTGRSAELGVSRQTLYQWQKQGQAALLQTFTPATTLPVRTPAVERAVLTLWAEGHASERGIQRCLEALGYGTISLGTIAAVVGAAQRRALRWDAKHQAPSSERVVALDEMFGNDRRGAYLSMVDTASWAVWAIAGPVAVDHESWTLLLWEAQERGLRWKQTVSDGGKAMQLACATADPQGRQSRDVWHVLHQCSQAQGRLDRGVAQLQVQSAVVVRQAARLLAGKRPQGAKPVTDVAAHRAQLAQAVLLAEGLRYLSGELRRLLEVVVLDGAGKLLSPATRQQELATLLALLAEVAAGAPAPQQRELQHLHRGVSLALPHLLTFLADLEPGERQAQAVLGTEGLGLVAWAWQRRRILGPAAAELVRQLPEPWRMAAAGVLQAWESAVRASSAVENWHSILRPHLAVRRTLSPGMLALLAVWHNHRVFARGERAGHSPLHLSGLTGAPTDWLMALGYPPVTPLALHPARANGDNQLAAAA